MFKKSLFAFSALILCVCLAPTAWAQQKENGGPGARRDLLRHRPLGMHKPLGVMPKAAGQSIIPRLCAPAFPSKNIKVYDLAHYPGGTWAEARGINDFGVVIGFGDIASGDMHPIGVPLFGPNAWQWFDLGTLGGEGTGSESYCMGVAETGLIIGSASIPGNDIIHAFAWTPRSGILDLGTLGVDHTQSWAFGVNKSGTLITGAVTPEPGSRARLPVVWTREVVWGPHGLAIAWKIQELDRTGFEEALAVEPWGVNDLGQITGVAAPSDTVCFPVLWNPLPGGKGWKLMRLPLPADSPIDQFSQACDINNRGEIVGSIVTADWSAGYPLLWKPVVPRRSIYDVTRLATLTGPEQGLAFAWAINDSGDIVGESYDADGNDLATLYNAKDPSFIKVLGFPGTGSYAMGVNNNHIAVGTYWSDTIPPSMAAVKFK